MDNTESPLDRMRRLDEPPTTQQSFDFIQEKQDAYLGAVPEDFPERPRSGLLFWVLVFATFAFLSGAVFQASRAEGQGTRGYRCINRVAALADPSVMAPQTAVRKSRSICRGLELTSPDFFKAITQ